MTVLRYAIAYVNSDTEGMKRPSAMAEGKPWAEDWMAQVQALASAGGGHIRLARQLSHKAKDLAMTLGQPERAAGYQSAFAVDEALFGYSQEAIRGAQDALKLSHGRHVEYTAALAFALASQSKQTDVLLKDLEARFPLDTAVKRIYVPVLQAVLAVKRGKNVDAVEYLQTGIQEDMGMVGDGAALLTNAQSPYIRGEALLRSGREQDALREFQKLVDHPAILFTQPIGALARLQIARGYRVTSNRTKAVTAYETFLKTWATADPGVPIFNAAQSETKRSIQRRDEPSCPNARLSAQFKLHIPADSVRMLS